MSDGNKIADILTGMAQQETTALRVPCPRCGAEPGVKCHPLARPDGAVAAHMDRHYAAGPLTGTNERLRAMIITALDNGTDPRLGAKKRAWWARVMEIYDAELERRQT